MTEIDTLPCGYKIDKIKDKFLFDILNSKQVPKVDNRVSEPNSFKNQVGDTIQKEPLKTVARMRPTFGKFPVAKKSRFEN